MRKYLTFFIIMILIIPAFADDEIVFFSDSNTGDEYYDSSWGFQEDPSYLELASTDKFPVDTLHPYQGAHSLRIHWISESGGDWGIAVASIGWVAHDFTEYDSIVYWINSPDSILKQGLPDLAIEDMSNKKSTRVWLGDYVDNVDDDTTTWQRIVIPIDAFEPGSQNADFTRIKTIFHFQKYADGEEHIAWVDEFRIIKKGGGGTTAPEIPQNLIAEGHDSRIDLKWTANTETYLLGYFIYRSESPNGPYSKLNNVVHEVNLYSDFFGENNKTYYYKVSAVNQNYQESPLSYMASAGSSQMTDEELLTSVQEAIFRYFWDYGHPVSGLARERKGSGETCTSGGTGFGLMAMIVGVERGFVERDSAAARVLKILKFLQNETPHYHGAWSHWINGTTGETIPFSPKDDGGDIVETAYLIQGILTIRQYFDQDNLVENEIRLRATQMWEDVEWDWYRRYASGNKLYWHWSPNYGWDMNMVVQGWNETMIVYLLAIASPTHSVPASLYYDGWAGRSDYENGNTYYGYKQWVGWPRGGPLFFTHYSYLGFDPRKKSDQYCNYYENNRNITLINRAYCIDNPENHEGYGPLVWGLTASDDPWGYLAHEPIESKDNGTITPTAAISAMPYTPNESLETMKHFYFTYGNRLWGEFGFKDAFNLNEDWFATSFLAIDQGPMVIMIENHRTELCWDLFMANSEMDTMLQKIGWTITDVAEESDVVIDDYKLFQNYPNPFNDETIIQFSLPEHQQVTIMIFNTMGEQVAAICKNKDMKPGNHRIPFKADHLSSGIYFFRLKTENYQKTRKMLLVR